MRRGAGTGAWPAGVDLDDVELGLDGRAGGAVAARRDRRARQQALGVAEPDGQLEVVARRAHRGGHQVAVEADLERLLDDELVGHAPLAQPFQLATSTEDGATPRHQRKATRVAALRSTGSFDDHGGERSREPLGEGENTEGSASFDARTSRSRDDVGATSTRAYNGPGVTAGDGVERRLAAPLGLGRMAEGDLLLA